jgi:ATP/maltotriose-dependent transcriptional regulator MalT
MGEDSAGAGAAGRVADAALRVLEHHDDALGLSRAWSLRAMVAWFQSQAADADEAWRHAAALARRAGDERELFEALCWRASAAAFGPTPVAEAMRRCEEIRETVRSSPFATALTLYPLALLHAMAGEIERARGLVAQSDDILRELGGMHAAVSHHSAAVEMLADSPASAEALLREGYVTLTAMGDGTLLATTAAMLAQAVYAQGRIEEAEELCRVSRRGAPEDDIFTQVIVRRVQAKVLAVRGDAGAAEALARAAVALVAGTDFLAHHGDTLLDLAEVLRLCDRPDDSYQAAQAALSLYAQKGNVVAAQRVRSRSATTNQGER